MIEVIVMFGILGIVAGLALASSAYECPREILGYNCRGKGCDHSDKLIKEAKEIRRLNYEQR